MGISAVNFLGVKLCGLAVPTDNKQLSDWISKVNVPVLGSLSVLGALIEKCTWLEQTKGMVSTFFPPLSLQQSDHPKKKVECLFLCLNKQEQLPQHYHLILKYTQPKNKTNAKADLLEQHI